MSSIAIAWRTWCFAGIGGVIVILLMLSLFRMPPIQAVSAPKTVPEVPAKVELAWQSNELLLDEVALRDPTPLFLPTKWNASEDALAMNAPREPGGSFQDYAPYYIFPENELHLEFRTKSQVPARPADVFAIGKADQTLEGLGQVDRPLVALAPRGAYVEVVATDSGRVVWSQALKDTPPEQGAWQPLDFIVAVDAAGIMGSPVLTESSRAADVDSFFKDYLIKMLHIGERLAPGFYRISIGP